MSKCICHSAGRLLFPALSVVDVHALLFGATCWPFGDCETVIGQLREMADNTDGTLMSALAWADEIERMAMEESA